MAHQEETESRGSTTEEHRRCDNGNAMSSLLAKMSALPVINRMVNVVQRIYLLTGILYGCVKGTFHTAIFIAKTAALFQIYIIAVMFNTFGDWGKLTALGTSGLGFMKTMVLYAGKAARKTVTTSKGKIQNFIEAYASKGAIFLTTSLAEVQVRLSAMIECLTCRPSSPRETCTTSSLLDEMNATLDVHLSEHERQCTDGMDNHSKALSLPKKAREILREANKVNLGERQATFIYNDDDDKPSMCNMLFSVIASLLCITAILTAKVINKIWNIIEQSTRGIIQLLTPVE